MVVVDVTLQAGEKNDGLASDANEQVQRTVVDQIVSLKNSTSAKGECVGYSSSRVH